MLYCESTNKFHQPFLWNTLVKAAKKVNNTDQTIQYTPCCLQKIYWTSMKYDVYIYDSFSSFLIVYQSL